MHKKSAKHRQFAVADTQPPTKMCAPPSPIIANEGTVRLLKIKGLLSGIAHLCWRLRIGDCGFQIEEGTQPRASCGWTRRSDNRFPSWNRWNRRGGCAIKKMVSFLICADGWSFPNTFRGLTTPSAPTLVAFGIIFLMARPPLLCKEGNTFLFKICPTPSPYFFAISAGMGYIAVRGRSLWIGRDRR